MGGGSMGFESRWEDNPVLPGVGQWYHYEWNNISVPNWLNDSVLIVSIPPTGGTIECEGVPLSYETTQGLSPTARDALYTNNPLIPSDETGNVYTFPIDTPFLHLRCKMSTAGGRLFLVNNGGKMSRVKDASGNLL